MCVVCALCVIVCLCVEHPPSPPPPLRCVCLCVIVRLCGAWTTPSPLRCLCVDHPSPPPPPPLRCVRQRNIVRLEEQLAELKDRFLFLTAQATGRKQRESTGGAASASHA